MYTRNNISTKFANSNSLKDETKQKNGQNSKAHLFENYATFLKKSRKQV